jgi:hypothetical protein
MCQLCGVHLIGSVAMPDAEQVFRTVAGELGTWLKRIPDGETGERQRWIYWQRDMLLSHSAMEIDRDAPVLELRQWDGKLIRKTELVRFRPGIDPAGVSFETGYAPAAIASYAVFRKLRAEGAIPSGIRFMVALPTPMASGYMYVSPGALADYLPVYERALLRALADIVAAIPAEDLSIQWDVCQEVLVYENYFPHRPADYKVQIAAELARLGNAVPAAVEMGYHLCYGTPRDEHLVMPKDMAIMVEMTAGLLAGLKRGLDYLHLPVPKDRDDDGYFAPLQELALPAETTLYLGLLHYDDAEGDKRRMAAATKLSRNFGLATECGWGRTDPQRVPGLIAAHRRAMLAAA